MELNAPLVLFCVLCSVNVGGAEAQLNGSALSPNLLNLAEGRNIWASATCGDGNEKEEYCILGETNVGQDYIAGQVVQGQLCDYCDMRDSRKSHIARYVIENNNKYWQSPPLSRSGRYNEVNLTIDLGQDFHVAYVFIVMGISPRPGVWALERSVDHGKTFTPWQYFASDENECKHFFGQNVSFTITSDDSVICETKYSSILPFQHGEIPIEILTGRPSYNNFSSSESLQEWSRATNIRLRLMRTKTLLADVLSVNQKDPTVTRRYFYSIRHIEVGGRCVCNGHASHCSPTYEGKLRCRCQHNTDGDQCEKCEGLYNQKLWQPASIDNRNECEKCNCHEHAHSCEYNATVEKLGLSLDIDGQKRGGGVCIDCLHHTAGINCEKCEPKYYRQIHKELTDTDVCTRCPCDFTGDDAKRYSGECEDETARCTCDEKYREPDCDDCADGYYGFPNCIPCDCFRNGTKGGLCHNNGRECPCEVNFGGEHCKECSRGFFNHPECQACECNPRHSLTPEVCDAVSGKCQCSNGFGGRQCDRCEVGHFAYPECQSCDCHPSGVTEGVCDPVSGKCFCKPGFTGDHCDRCADGFFGPDCHPCKCDPDGSVREVCSDKGRCKCRLGRTGDKCDKCAAGYFTKYDNKTCLACGCDRYGADGESCDAEGRCFCKPNFRSGDNFKCNVCAPGHYKYPFCEACNCNPLGTSSDHQGCQTGGDTLCVCKERVEGRRCDTCKPLFYNLRATSEACENCFCEESGTHSAIQACEPHKGQCPCKSNRDGRACAHCVAGTFKRSADNIFGCEDCECNPSGSIKDQCDERTGCRCRNLIGGAKCDKPTKLSYVPTFHQFIYEVEAFRTPKRPEVRQGSNETEFPGFSGMGYAIFNELQTAIIIDVEIKKNSMHQVVLRYTNPADVPQEMLFTLTPGSDEVPSKQYKAKLPPAKTPTFIKLPAFKDFEGDILPGPWTIQMESMNVAVDYLVTLPQEYISAAALKEEIKRPCKLGEDRPCRKMAYPPLPRAVETFVGIQDSAGVTLPKEIDNVVEKAAVLSPVKPLDLQLNGFEPSSMFFIEYSSKKRQVDEFRQTEPNGVLPVARAEVIFELAKNSYKAQLVLPYCRYSFLCRQVVIDPEGRVFESPDLWGERSQSRVRLSLENAPLDEEVYIYKIAAVPRSVYGHHLLNISTVCIRDEDFCHGLKYNNLGKKVYFAQTGDYMAIDPRIEDKSLRLVELSPSRQSVIIDGEVTPDDGRESNSNILIHYYQPDFGDFEADVNIENEGVSRNGKVRFAHCPSTTGCRTRVYVDKPNEPLSMHLSGVYSIEIKLPVRREDDDMLLAKHLNKDYDEASLGPYGKTWLDYVVTSTSLSSKDLRPLPYDQSRKFLDRCITDPSYHVDPENMSDYCKDGLFRLTTSFNNGALRCRCNTEGSNGFSCKAYGGQCSCKPNVIGRQCTECKAGYYGFPNCKKCQCPPNAVCNKVTGECSCPPHVVGDNCDRCKPLYFDYSPQGCAFCGCSVSGVKRGNLQCDLVTGDCDCRANINGRKCDHCQDGYYGYPHCKFCNCYQGGVRKGACDKDTAECKCKEKVGGRFCDTCLSGYYFLDEANPVGCTKCFCSSKTSTCDSAPLRRINITDHDGWYRVTVHMESLEVIPGSEEELEASTDQSAVVITQLSDDPPQEGEVVYIQAPESFLFNRLTSYGGKLTVTISTQLQGDEEIAEQQPDVLLVGADETFIHVIDSENTLLSNQIHYSVVLKESSFVTEMGKFRTIDRAQFMQQLTYVKAILVRVAYFKDIDNVAISVTMDDAESADDIDEVEDRVYAVEECQCPSGYAGLSCEQCASGYFRSGTQCKPCNCHDHTQECDPDTGRCLNCEHNTEGDHCENCKAGFYRDPRHPKPYDCRTCPCPVATPENNFAISCELSGDPGTIHCVCPDGYSGNRCDLCDTGYWGDPTKPNEKCRRCECNGNADLSVEENCDKVNGTCLNCKNNAAGKNCEICEAWYWGDAVDRKDCADCGCDRRGAEKCDASTGKCICKQNVVGPYCDQCARDHWGIADGQGCLPCNCGRGANSTNCNLEDGKCNCKPGVSGNQCDQCAKGYWNLTENGCQPCNCDISHAKGMSCDTHTGDCVCLPGVTGKRCDKCPDRQKFVENEGCLVCDVCHHQLLDSTEELFSLMYVLEAETDDINSALLNNRAFVHFTNELLMSRNEMNHIRNVTAGSQLSKTEQELAEREDSLRDMSNRLDRLYKDWQDIYNDLQPETRTADELQALHDRIKEMTRRMNEYKQLLENRIANDIPIRESQAAIYKNEAEDIARRMQTLRLDSNTEATVANTLPQELEDYDLRPYIEQIDKVKSISASMAEMREVHSKILDISKRADHDVSEVKKIISTLKEENKIKSLIEDTQVRRNTTADTLKKFEDATKEANKAIEGITQTIQPDLIDLAKQLPGKQNELRIAQEKLMVLKPPLAMQVDEAIRHEQELRKAVEQARHTFHTGMDNSARYLEAANRFKDMSETVVNSEKALQMGGEGLDKLQTQDIEKSATGALNVSKNVKMDADKGISDIEDLRKSLRNAFAKLTDAELIHRERQDMLRTFNGTLDTPATPDFKELPEITRKATQAFNTTQKFNDLLKNGTGEAGSLVSALKAIKDADRYLAETEGLLKNDDLARKLNNIEAQINSFNRTHSKISANLVKLREKILVTRGIADSIPIGVELSGRPDTRIKYIKPSALHDIKAWMDISMFVNTSAPDGALLYIGPDVGNGVRRKRQADAATNRVSENKIGEYILVKLENYQVCVDIALDNSKVQKFKNQRPLIPYKVHMIKIERTGTKIEISVHDGADDEQFTETSKITGSSFVLAIEPSDPIYIGQAPGEVGTVGFRGQISNVVINNVRIGQWEYRKRTGYKPNGSIPQPTKNSFRSLQTPVDQAFRHFHNGYLMLNKTYLHRFTNEMDIKIVIKTHTPEGLLFMHHNQALQRYVVLQIRNGRPELVFELGDYTKGNFSVNQIVNTGNETKISLIVNREIIRMQVDAAGTSATNHYTISQKANERREMKILDNISRIFYIGGMPLSEQPIYEGVVTTSYEGCITGLEISHQSVSLSEYISSLGTTEGCRQKVVRKLSLGADTGDQHKYLRLNRFDDVFSTATISFRFKTKEKNGLIFFGRQGDPIDTSLTIALSDGSLVIFTKPGGAFVSGLMLNLADGRWHYAVIQLKPNRVNAVIDDQAPSTQVWSRAEWKVNAPFFFGGLSDEVAAKVHLGSKYVQAQFSGCIADFTIDDHVVNFDDGQRFGVTLSSCNAVTFDELRETGDDDKKDQDFQCKLKYGPSLPYDHLFNNSEAAYRYGALPHTRGESPVDSRGKIRNETVVDLEFRVGQYFSDGTLFLASTATPRGHFDYVLIYLTNGTIKAAFDLRTGAVVAEIPNRLYNDGKYHKLKLERRRWNAALIIDDQRSADVQDKEKSEHLDEVNTLFVGGMREEHVTLFSRKFPLDRNAFTSFPGCIKNVIVNGERVVFAESLNRVLPCLPSQYVEDGAYFGYRKGKRSWLSLNEQIISGSSRISMTIKSRRHSSILFFSAHTKEDNHLALFLVNGTVLLQTKHEGKINKVNFVGQSICDGDWHRITISLQGLVIGVSVDDQAYNALPISDWSTLPNVLTNGPIYIGGLPKGVRDMSLVTTSSYGGCIKDLRIDMPENDDSVNTISGLPPRMNLAQAAKDIKGEVSLSTCYRT